MYFYFEFNVLFHIQFRDSYDSEITIRVIRKQKIYSVLKWTLSSASTLLKFHIENQGSCFNIVKGCLFFSSLQYCLFIYCMRGTCVYDWVFRNHFSSILILCTFFFILNPDLATYISKKFCLLFCKKTRVLEIFWAKQ